MKPFALAWTFLTVLPAPGRGPASMTDFVRSRIWYPAVGAALGILWCGFFLGARRLHAPDGVLAFAVLAGMLGSTGFLHLDGLLDAADALLVPKSPSDRLRILKDVHMGSFAFGVGGLWFAGMFAALSALRDPWILVALPVLSRGVLLLPVHLLPYARSLPDDPSSLTRESPDVPRALWIVPAACTALAFGFRPLEGFVVLAVQLGFCAWSARRLGGGITGDIYGAAIVLSELAALLVHILARSA